jgi:hypothetical protein
LIDHLRRVAPGLQQVSGMPVAFSKITPKE